MPSNEAPKGLTRPEFRSSFDSAWDRLTSRFFKFESLQYYEDGPDSPFVDFVRGDYDSFISKIVKYRREDAPYYAQARSRGAQFVRVHALTMPPTDYLKHEAYSYAVSELLGESIFAIEASKAQSLVGGPLRDFVLFGSDTLLFQDYEEGVWTGACEVTDFSAIGAANLLADSLVASAMPFRKLLPLDPALEQRITEAFQG